MTYRTTIGWWLLCGVLAGLAQTGCGAPEDFTAPPRVATADRLPDVAHRHTVRVVPGMSLQTAVDAVGAGGTVLSQSGVYPDSVVVTAPGVRLRGLDGGEGEGVVIENPTHISLTQSRSFDNTVGILVSLLPGLPVMTSGDIVVAHNRVEGNNRPNFGNPADIVALLPSGSGILVIGPDRVTVSHNTVTGNRSTGIALGSALILTQLAGLPPDVFGSTDPTPDQARIEFNEAVGNGSAPLPPFGSLFPGVDLLWDGLGTGNCWRQNRYGTSLPTQLPICS
ncbi:MAG TPA: right-handed parallel beta-helix repeat-containing protein [Gemmatimonadaceae bacterium]|jgi:hypothetical protein|nr:right-handed parallel beta-helix repeat-containing protein [Gemmatimonadaceae bacterium]